VAGKSANASLRGPRRSWDRAPRLFPWIAAAACLASACGGPSAQLKATSRGSYDPATGKLVEITYDKNKDGVVDTWVRMDGPRPVCAQLDTNEDGVVDRWEYYGANGQLVRAAWLREKPANAPPSQHPGAAMSATAADEDPCAPLPGEAKPDTWATMGPDGTPARIEYTETSVTTGKPVMGRREFYEGGTLVRAEADTDGDGTIDRWETWVNGKLTQVAIDDNAATTVVMDANGATHLASRGPQSGTPTRRLTYDASGKLVLIETEPDGQGGFRKRTIPK